MAAVLLGGVDVRAGEEDDLAERRQAAQDLADSAFDLLQKERYAAAAELFEKADETFHSPVFIVFRAEAVHKQGDLVGARKLLQAVVDEKLADYAPDAFREAQDEARGKIADLDAVIPTITVRLAGSGAVTMNGEPLSSARIGTPIQVNPGTYELSATGSAERSDSASLTVAEGDRQVAELDVSAPQPAIQPLPGSPPPEGDDGEGIPIWIWPTIAYGVGGVGLIMGVAAGGVFVGKQSSLKDACKNDGDGDPNTCPPDQQSKGDSVKTLGNVSTAGWVIAGLGAAAGTVLLFVPLGDQGPVVSAKLNVGPGWLGVGGRF